MEPLPGLLKIEESGVKFIAEYDRREKSFRSFAPLGFPYCDGDFFDTFDECRIEMMARSMRSLADTREQCRLIAANMKHVRNLPIATFPDVVPEVSEAQQQEAEGQEEAKAEEVKPAIIKPQPKRHSR